MVCGASFERSCGTGIVEMGVDAAEPKEDEIGVPGNIIGDTIGVEELLDVEELVDGGFTCGVVDVLDRDVLLHEVQRK